jgi:hypothetical protein
VLQKQFTKAMHYWGHEVFVRTRPQAAPGAAEATEASAPAVN